MKQLVFGVLLFSSLGAIACGSKEEEEEDLPEVDCATVVVPRFSEVTAFVTCSQCHSSALQSPQARKNANPMYNFDTYDAAIQYPMEIVEEVYSGSMPPASVPALSETQKQQVYAWALCGTPR